MSNVHDKDMKKNESEQLFVHEFSFIVGKTSVWLIAL
jgi:hypothetical protein